MTATDIAYLAGLLDGEGCIRIDRGRLWNRARTTWHWRYKLTVRINMCAKPTILWVQAHFGGKVYARSETSMRCLSPRSRQQWGWIVAEKQAEQVIRLVLPYLCNKHDEATLALQFRRTVPRAGQRSSETLRAQQVRLSEQISACKLVEYPVA